MAIPLSGLTNNEVVPLPEGVEKILVFGGAVVVDVGTQKEITVTGPLDLNKHGARAMSFTHPVTGAQITRPGVTLLVKEEDGKPVNKPLNILSKRLIAQISADLANGDYLKYRYHITAVGAAPTTHYTVNRVPLSEPFSVGKIGTI